MGGTATIMVTAMGMDTDRNMVMGTVMDMNKIRFIITMIITMKMGKTRTITIMITDMRKKINMTIMEKTLMATTMGRIITIMTATIMENTTMRGNMDMMTTTTTEKRIIITINMGIMDMQKMLMKNFLLRNSK